MEHKTAPARVKALEDGEGGTFEALVSVFGNVDSVGDRVVKGAFAETLKEWETSGDPIPVLWSHMSSDPDMHIGVVEAAEERDDGLWVRGRLDLDAPKAAQVYRLLKGRRVTQFSFAYDVLDAAPVVDDGDTVLELKRLKLYEVGPTLIGANPATELLDVKALRTLEREVKSGRVLSAKNEGRLREAHAAIGDVLSALEPADDAGKANDGTAKTKAGDAGNVEEPTRSPATVRLAAELELAAL